MKSIDTFQHDRWVPTPVENLRIGDFISQGGQVAKVSAPPYEENGITHIPASAYDPGPIRLMVGEATVGKEHILMALDMVGSELAEFDDGTALITDFPAGHNLVYSPRLPVEELEKFCAKHIERYQSFFDEHTDEINDGQAVPMKPWWTVNT